MKIVDLFSGIGGFSYAAEKLVGGFETVAFVEREPYCQKVLRKHWHNVPIFSDIRSFDGKEFRDADIVVGGFPCQPWSVAGEQRGDTDDRDLWHEMVRVIEDIRPRWIIGENVRGFVNQPLGLQRSLSDLESLGYQTAPFVIPACAVDAPHRRDRVWIVAHTAQLQRDGGREHPEPRERQVSQSRQRGGADDMADADDTRLQGRQEAGDISRKRARQNKQLERCRDGKGPTWLPEPGVGRVANGVSRRVDRLKALGNAVVPQVVEQIGRAIMAS